MASCAGTPAFTRLVTAVCLVLKDEAAGLAADREARGSAGRRPRGLEVSDAAVRFRMRAPWGAERAVEDEAAVQAARGMEALDQGERAAVERQDGGPLRLHLGRRPGELLGHRVPVRPRGARELALARPREVGELEEISQRGGQGGVHRRECGGVEVLAEGTRLVEQEVGEVEASGVEHELAVGTRATEATIMTMNAPGLVSIRSRNSVQVTVDRLEASLKAKGITVFARIDHAAGAAAVGRSLRPTELLIFGNSNRRNPTHAGAADYWHRPAPEGARLGRCERRRLDRLQ
jgi:hypothetical protein